jgi:hypothetical protein
VAHKFLLQMVGTIAGQIVYYFLLLYAWMSLGWKYNATHGHLLGDIVTLLACVVNPLLCAYVANQTPSVEKKLYAAMKWSILLLAVLVCAPLSSSIWYYASGYYRYLVRTSTFRDTVAFTSFFNMVMGIIGSLIAGIVFVACYRVLKKRRNNDRNRLKPT